MSTLTLPELEERLLERKSPRCGVSPFAGVQSFVISSFKQFHMIRVDALSIPAPVMKFHTYGDASTVAPEGGNVS